MFGSILEGLAGNTLGAVGVSSSAIAGLAGNTLGSVGVGVGGNHGGASSGVVGVA